MFTDGSKIENVLTETVLRGILNNGFKNSIKWATVTTPSGVTKDVTNKLSTI